MSFKGRRLYSAAASRTLTDCPATTANNRLSGDLATDIICSPVSTVFFSSSVRASHNFILPLRGATETSSLLPGSSKPQTRLHPGLSACAGSTSRVFHVVVSNILTLPSKLPRTIVFPSSEKLGRNPIVEASSRPVLRSQTLRIPIIVPVTKYLSSGEKPTKWADSGSVVLPQMSSRHRSSPDYRLSPTACHRKRMQREEETSCARRESMPPLQRGAFEVRLLTSCDVIELQCLTRYN